MTDRPPVIFLAFANDRDDRARYLRNLAEELRKVRERLDRVETGRLCEVVVRTGTTVRDLLDVFQDPRYRDRVAVFHFAGHAGGYELLLESAEGRPEFAHAAGLAEFLGHQRGLQLVFLNGCSTQPQVDGLLQSGVPAVIATSESIDDSMAMELSARFYAALAGGATIATAYAESAAAVKTVKGDRTRDVYRAEAADSDRWPWDLYLNEGADVVREWSLPKAAGDPLFGLPPLPEQDLPDTPYRHLQWFREEDAELFFGRGREIRAFYELVTSPSSAPILLFYGQSGVGKSSVLAAGLLPRLASSHHVRYTRRQDLGLAETLAAAVGAAEPDASVAARWHAVETETGQPLVVILDQVEEVYTRPGPDDPDELERFLQVVSETFADRSARPRGKLVLGFRKEWLADIEERLLEKKLPRSKSYLERLDRNGIVEIVMGPAKSERLRTHFNLTVEPGLAELIADDLLEDRDAPVAPTLEVLLTKMWNQTTARNADAPAFTTDVYQELRRKGLLLDDFLSEQLSALHDWNAQVVSSGLALDLLAFHTTPLGTAEARTRAEIDAAYPHQNSALPGLVQQNKDLYLLVDHTSTTEKGDSRTAGTRLAHDTLAPLVRRRFKDSDAPGQRARRILENRGDEWQEGKVGNALDEADLATVERGESGMPGWSEDERRLIQASRKGRRNRRWRRGSIVTLMLVFVVVIIRQYVRALDNERQAVSRALAATAKIEPRLDLALLLSVEALRTDTTFEARDALLGTLLRPTPGLRSRILTEVSSMTISPDGTTLAFVRHRQLGLWDLKRQALITDSLGGDLDSVAFSPDGATVASLSSDGIRLWNLTRHPVREELLAGATGLWAFAPDGATLTFLNGLQLGRWDLRSKVLTVDSLVPAQDVGTLALSPDGTILVSGGGNGTLRLWDLTQRPLVADSIGNTGTGWVIGLAFGPDGTTIVSSSTDGRLSLLDLRGRKFLGDPIRRHMDFGLGVAFSQDSTTLAFINGAQVGVWDLKKQELIVDTLPGGQDVSSVALGPHGTIASIGAEGLSLWDLKGRLPVEKPLSGTEDVSSVAFTPDGSTLISRSSDGTVSVWDLKRRPPIGDSLKKSDSASGVAFSSDGTGLASCGSNSGLAFRPDRTTLACVSPDGTTLAAVTDSTLGDPGSLRLWDVKTRRPLGEPLATHIGKGSKATFSRDGRILTWSTPDGIRLWEVSTAAWAGRACALAGRNLTTDEWVRYFPGRAYKCTCPALPRGDGGRYQ